MLAAAKGGRLKKSRRMRGLGWRRSKSTKATKAAALTTSQGHRTGVDAVALPAPTVWVPVPSPMVTPARARAIRAAPT